MQFTCKIPDSDTYIQKLVSILLLNVDTVLSDLTSPSSNQLKSCNSQYDFNVRKSCPSYVTDMTFKCKVRVQNNSWLTHCVSETVKREYISSLWFLGAAKSILVGQKIMIILIVDESTNHSSFVLLINGLDQFRNDQAGSLQLHLQHFQFIRSFFLVVEQKITSKYKFQG